ncbi:OsmC family protein [Ramlibacter sp.]|uniref:OsmC family protein n=1 Tax=Ramlibacter sp. TaxID=1917967 RepID=UPI002FC72ECE
MHPLPHHYRAQAQGAATGDVTVVAPGLPPIATQPPPEFDGPEGFWSPETLLLASIADCYILSLRAVARASKLEWISLQVDVAGVLDKVDGVTRFTRFTLTPRLLLPAGTQESTALNVLKKAKSVCLVTNSLHAECELAPALEFAPQPTTLAIDSVT